MAKYETFDRLLRYSKLQRSSTPRSSSKPSSGFRGFGGFRVEEFQGSGFHRSGFSGFQGQPLGLARPFRFRAFRANCRV